MAKTATPSSRAQSAANFDALFGVQKGERVVSGGFKMLAPDRITTRPQVRRTFPPDEMQELRSSIHELREQGLGIEGSGILQALVVVPEGDGYRLIMGEKRLRCALAEGLGEVPCIIIAAMSEGLTRLLQLTENALRSNPPILDEAEALHETQQEQKLSIRDLARLLGKGKGYIEDRLNLLAYPDEVKNMVSARADSLRAARHIADVEDPKLRLELARAVIEDEISEREVQRRISGDDTPSSTRNSTNSTAKSGTTSTRSTERGDGESRASSERHDPLTQCLKPASGFVAEAARLLKTIDLSHDYRHEIEAEIDVLEKQIAEIRKNLA